MKKALFITGTDTGVGKTYVAVKLIQQYVAQGYRVVGMKPIAAGCETIDGVWQNEDVAKLIDASNVSAPREWINPYCFDPPIAPHIAAELAAVTIQLEVIQHAYHQLSRLADIVIVEGAGGLLVPVNQHATMATIAQFLNLPVLLVVGMKLGCINHAALTKVAIERYQLELEGWVANTLGNRMLYLEENIEYIRHLFGAQEHLFC